MTDRKWPGTDSERTAEILERLAARFREYGDKPIELASDFLQRSLPSSTERGPLSQEEAADAAAERQLTKDCTDYRAGLRFVHDVVADFDERTARILAKVGEGHICPWHRCGRRIDPKRERVKWWQGRDPMHPSCYLARWRHEKGDQQAS